MADSIQKEAALAEANRDLALAVDQTQQRCAFLEAKLQRMRKYRALILAAGQIECKNCGHPYPSNIFGAHLKLCHEFTKAQDHAAFISTGRGALTARMASPTQVVACG